MEASDVPDDAITNIRKNLIKILTTMHSEAIQKRGCVSLLWKQKKRFVKPAWFCSHPVKPTTFKWAAGVKSMISKRFTFLALSLIMITKHFKSCNCVSQLVSIYIRAERLIEWGCKLENYILRHLISLVNDSRHACCVSLEAANDVQTLCRMFLSQQGQKPLCQLFCQFEERAPILVSCTSQGR